MTAIDLENVSLVFRVRQKRRISFKDFIVHRMFRDRCRETQEGEQFFECGFGLGRHKLSAECGTQRADCRVGVLYHARN